MERLKRPDEMSVDDHLARMRSRGRHETRGGTISRIDDPDPIPSDDELAESGWLRRPRGVTGRETKIAPSKNPFAPVGADDLDPRERSEREVQKASEDLFGVQHAQKELRTAQAELHRVLSSNFETLPGMNRAASILRLQSEIARLEKQLRAAEEKAAA
jgi:hypothetical protein